MSQNITIRPEKSGDIEIIAHITELAFRSHPYSNQTEQFIITELRQADALSVSLVAEIDSQVVGHIAFSPVIISDGSQNWYALGPISVTPEFQRQGIGQALVNAGLDALRSLRAEGCVLVGDPGFYGRFGFRNRQECTLAGVPPEFFLSLPLGLHPAVGNVTLHAAFSAHG